MEKYIKADITMKNEIMQLMVSCFGDPIWIIEFFFKERLDINNCYVCVLDNKIVSVLHTIKSNLKIGKQILKGIYIYGACTLREYRNRGFMTNLLNYVQSIYAKMGYDCCFLVPDNESLFKFYEKKGYKNFFKIKKIELTRDELLKLLEKDKNYTEADDDLTQKLNFSEMKFIREEVSENQTLVLYNEKDIEFAGKIYELFSSGKIVSTNDGYGICAYSFSGEIKVRDFTCRDSKEIVLLRKIYTLFSNSRKYTIETSCNNKFFKKFGKIVYNGMILPLSEVSNILIENQSFFSGGSTPYLGISLD